MYKINNETNSYEQCEVNSKLVVNVQKNIHVNCNIRYPARFSNTVDGRKANLK